MTERDSRKSMITPKRAARRRTEHGPSCDMDEHGDPIAEGFAERLHRDLEIERGLCGLDLIPPAYAGELRERWLKEYRERKRRKRKGQSKSEHCPR